MSDRCYRIWSSKGNSVMEQKQLIKRLLQENKGTNFVRCLKDNLSIIYECRAKTGKDDEKEKQLFSNRELYTTFCISSFFYLKLKYHVFQKKKESTPENAYKEYNIPPLAAFHYSKHEREMEKNRSMEMINQGDVLNLKIVGDEGNEFQLQILNKYGHERRIIDDSLFAVLLKNNPFVMQIFPPFQISDYVTAAVSSKCKREAGVFKNVIMTLNDSFVTNQNLKYLKLGRVFKKDIPFFPEDISDYYSFGAYLERNVMYRTPQKVFQHISAFGCDTEKTGPYYIPLHKKQKPGDVDNSLSEAKQKINILKDKYEKAKDNLSKGHLEIALLEIEEALQACPESDSALTLRGKIFLAMAGGKPSSKVRKAFMSFEAALKTNPLNKEAMAFHDLIVMESINSLSVQDKKAEAEELKANLKNPNQMNKSAVAFMYDIKNGKMAMAPANPKANTPPKIGVDSVEEPMDW